MADYTKVVTATIRVMGEPRRMAETDEELDARNQKVHDEFWATAVSHAEDAVNDNLPEGYYCKIEQT